MDITINAGLKVLVSALLAVALTLVVAGGLEQAANTNLNGISYSQLAQSATVGGHLVV